MQSISNDTRRKLTCQEINEIRNQTPIHQQGYFDTIRSEFESIMIRPCFIPRLKKKWIQTIQQSIVQPGECVGILAAQSIGSKLTQLTLNTFHSAGQATQTVVTGVPRFLKLLDASKNILDESCSVYFNHKPRTIQEIIPMTRYFTFQRFKDWIQSTHIYHSNDPTKHNVPEWYRLTLLNQSSLDADQYRTRIEFHLSLEKLKYNQMELNEIIEICKQVYPELEYISSPLYMGQIHILSNHSKGYELDELIRSIQQIKLCGIEGIRGIQFKKRVPELNGIPEWTIETIGTDLQAILEIDGVDCKRTTSHSIWETFRVFGLEAARQVFIQEIKNVIEGDGLIVHSRHIQLLVDAMTYSGMIRSANRYGIHKEEVGPFAKVSFEESLKNFISAASTGEHETTKGVSSAIICGKTPFIGSGLCDLLISKSCVEETFDSCY